MRSSEHCKELATALLSFELRLAKARKTHGIIFVFIMTINCIIQLFNNFINRPLKIMSQGERTDKIDSCMRPKYQHSYYQNKQSGIQLLKEEILSSYQELQAYTIRLQELDNILEIWENITDHSLKSLAKFIREFYNKFKKQIDLQKQYNCLVAKNQVAQLCQLQNRQSSTTDIEIVESIMSQCPACEDLIVFADKHNIKSIVQDSILKCIQEKIRGKQYGKILKQLQDFVETYSKPLIHKKLKQLLIKFDRNLSSQTAFQTKVENDQIDSSTQKLMNIKIDLQILNSEIIDDIESLIEFDKNGEYSTKICETLSNFIGYIENNEIKKLVIDLIQGMSFIFTDRFLMESSELFHYITHEKSDLEFVQEIPRRPQSTRKSTKSQCFINQYREYCENLYDKYLMDLKEDQNQQNQGIYLTEYGPEKYGSEQRMVFLKKLEREVIEVVWEYVESLQKKEYVEGRIGKIQEKIGNLENEKYQYGDRKNYDLPLQTNNHFSNRSMNQKAKNLQIAKNLTINENYFIESFKVRKQMHISVTGSSKGASKKVNKYQAIKKNTQERLLEFSKKTLIFLKCESTFKEQIQIKRISKIVKTTQNQLVFHFTKGYMSVQFLPNENSPADTLLKDFLAIFIDKYGEVYPDIVFENKSRITPNYNHSKSSYQKPTFQMYAQSYYE